jgi:pimeloyl-ACP methyl ester carboxylesterase
MNAADAVRRVSVVSAGQVQIRPEHVASTWRLLLIQQGPGLPMINEARRFERVLRLEQAFTVVYWDQRGCGRSLRRRQDRIDCGGGTPGRRSYAFTAAASIHAVEETLIRSPRGAYSPATAFGSDFVLAIPDTTRIDEVQSHKGRQMAGL